LFASRKIAILFSIFTLGNSPFHHSAWAMAPPKFMYQWGSKGTNPDQFQYPGAVTIDSEGKVLVGDCWNRQIKQFTAQGILLGAWEISTQQFSDFSIDTDGNLYIAYTGNANAPVLKYSKDGEPIGPWGNFSNEPAGYGLPRSLAFRPQGDAILVNYRFELPPIYRMSMNGDILETWGSIGSAPGQFICPRDVAVDQDGNIYVCDTANWRIQKLSPTGEFLRAWGGEGDAPGQFHNQPMRIAVSSSGKIYVLAWDQIQIFTLGGDFLCRFGSQGQGEGQFYAASGLAVDTRDLLYVADSANHRLQKFGNLPVVTTNPSGLSVRVDGKEFITPMDFDWSPGSIHTVEAIGTFQQSDTRHTFTSWSDGGSIIHDVVVSDDFPTYSANYLTEYFLKMLHSEYGTAEPQSGWVPKDTPVTIQGIPDLGYRLENWMGIGAGSYSGTDESATIIMKGPIVESASFIPGSLGLAYDFVLSASPDSPEENWVSPSNGIRNIYLWLTCSVSGLAAMEAKATGSLQRLGFETMNGVLNAGDQDHLLLAVGGCPSGFDVSMPLGYWIVWDDGGTVCLDRWDENQILGAVDCDPMDPTLVLNPGVLGFSSTEAPCLSGINSCRRIFGDGPHEQVIDDKDGKALSLNPVRIESIYPNPFSSEVAIQFSLPAAGSARVTIYDVAGRLVRELSSGEHSAGEHQLSWDGRNREGLPNSTGVYFVRLESSKTTAIEKLLQVRPR
jgi:DNA-binding beta-propeller fold protein YncE